MTEHKTLRFRITGPKEDVLEWMDRMEEEVEEEGYFINFRPSKVWKAGILSSKHWIYDRP